LTIGNPLDEDQVRTVLSLRPLAEPPLVCRGQVRLADEVLAGAAAIIACASSKPIEGISSGTSGRSSPTSPTAAWARSPPVSTMPASTSRTRAMTSWWSSMNPSSTSSDTYSARWRTVSCGSARKTGPTS
jgi:hypothetical protein